MLLTKKVHIKLQAKNIKHFESLEYNIDSIRTLDKNKKLRIKRGIKLLVDVKDLMSSSNECVDVLCDYCNENISTKTFNSYNYQRRYIQKDCCDDFDCRVKKYKEVMELKYNVINSFQMEEVKDKIKKYNQDNFGVDNYTQTNEFKEKTKQICLDKYGKNNLFQVEEIKEKIKQTNLDKYGVENYTQTEEYKEKTKQTCLNKYGVENPMQNTNIKNYAIKRQLKSKYENGTGIKSAQQTYLCELYSGELNYPFGRCLLDIAFPEDKIYIEYDGGGHNLIVKLGQMSEKDFKTKEIKRQYYCKSNGWKLIRIISSKDLLPSDDVLIDLLNIWFKYLKETEHTWVCLDIDNGIIKSAEKTEKYDYGELRKIENNKEKAI